MRALLAARAVVAHAAWRPHPVWAPRPTPPARAAAGTAPPHCAACDTPPSAVASTTPPADPPHTVDDDDRYMGLALAQAAAAAARGEVPVGAVLVDAATGAVLAAAGNRVEADADPTAHAEVLVLRAAAAAGGGWRLGGATLYVTLEPCAMCAGAALLARVGRLVYGARNVAAGADGSWVGLLPRGEAGEGEVASTPLAPPPPRPHASHPDMVVTRGVREAECGAAVVDFFRRRRAEGGRAREGAD